MSKSKSKSHCDWRSVSQYVLVSSPNMGHLTRDFFFWKLRSCLLLGRPLWREVGSVMYEMSISDSLVNKPNFDTSCSFHSRAMTSLISFKSSKYVEKLGTFDRIALPHNQNGCSTWRGLPTSLTCARIRNRWKTGEWRSYGNMDILWEYR
jgi:hypothetical protein